MSKANLTSLMGSESLGTLPSLTMLGTLLQVVTTPTVNVADAFSAIPLWGAEGVGNRPQGGGLSLQGSMRIIAPNTSVLLEFENNSAAACAWYAYFKQFEIKPATMLALAEV